MKASVTENTNPWRKAEGLRGSSFAPFLGLAIGYRSWMQESQKFCRPMTYEEYQLSDDPILRSWTRILDVAEVPASSWDTAGRHKSLSDADASTIRFIEQHYPRDFSRVVKYAKESVSV